MIFVTSSFPKSSVFKMPLVPILMQSQRFHISLGLKSVSEELS